MVTFMEVVELLFLPIVFGLAVIIVIVTITILILSGGVVSVRNQRVKENIRLAMKTSTAEIEKRQNAVMEEWQSDAMANREDHLYDQDESKLRGELSQLFARIMSGRKRLIARDGIRAEELEDLDRTLTRIAALTARLAHDEDALIAASRLLHSLTAALAKARDGQHTFAEADDIKMQYRHLIQLLGHI